MGDHNSSGWPLKKDSAESTLEEEKDDFVFALLSSLRLRGVRVLDSHVSSWGQALDNTVQYARQIDLPFAPAEAVYPIEFMDRAQRLHVLYLLTEERARSWDVQEFLAGDVMPRHLIHLTLREAGGRVDLLASKYGADERKILYLADRFKGITPEQL